MSHTVLRTSSLNSTATRETGRATPDAGALGDPHADHQAGEPANDLGGPQETMSPPPFLLIAAAPLPAPVVVPVSAAPGPVASETSMPWFASDAVVGAIAAAAAPAAPPIFTLEQIEGQLQRQWGGKDEGTTRTWTDGTLEYAMPDSAPSGSEGSGFVPMTATQKAYAREAFELWDDLIQTNLTETTSEDAQITLAYSSATTKGGTYTVPTLKGQLPGGSTFDREIDHERIWMSTNGATWPELQSGNMAYGERGLETYVHEIGHSLGLSHPGTYNAGDGNTYATGAEYRQDTQQYTIMSYWAPGADGTAIDRTGNFTSDVNGDLVNAATPMLHDIAAIQAKYGADTTTRTGDTVYGFNSNANRGAFHFDLNPDPVVAIWDAGGIDTLDCSGYSQNQRIDLREGTFSDVGALTLNVAIAFGVNIENARGGLGNDAITGNDGDNVLSGGAGNDALRSLGGDDTLFGNSGDDSLVGGFGFVDVLYGGVGNDTYYLDDFDTIVEAAGAGIDTVRSSLRYVLGDNLENLVLTGANSVNGFGNTLDNVLRGNDGNNYLQGAGGFDTLIGGKGNDYYELGDVSLVSEQDGWAYDRVIEAAGGGIDTVSVAYAGNSSYFLDDNIEKVIVAGSVGGFQVIGNALDNTFTGNAGNNQLFGQAGNDTLNGGAGLDQLNGGDGNDTYVLDDVTLIDEASGWTYDMVGEAVGGGIDTVLVSYQGLSAVFLDDNVENVRITGDAGGMRVIGNDIANGMVGNAGNNQLFGQGGNDTLDGGAGIDQLSGGEGDDVYLLNDINYVDEATGFIYDIVGEGLDGGTDTVFVSYQGNLRYTIDDNVENATVTGTSRLDVFGNGLANGLVGNAANNVLAGLAGNDTIDGGAGIDTLYGGLGNDLYRVDNAADVVVEASAQPGEIDRVVASVSWTLGDNLENLTLTGRAAIDGTGNGLANRIAGNAAANRLDGVSGADTLIGGLGNDTYVVNGSTDSVRETSTLASEIDRVLSSVDWTLGANLERLTLTGTRTADGTGNGLANVLTGNRAANVLDGAGGNDVLAGGLGNDRLHGGSGFDSFSFGTALNGTGNVDRIDDFDAAHDRLLLDNAIFKALGAPGALAAAAFHAGTAAGDASDRIVYDAGTGHLFYDADGNGAGAQVLFATVNAGSTLTGADLFVV